MRLKISKYEYNKEKIQFQSNYVNNYIPKTLSFLVQLEWKRYNKTRKTKEEDKK